MSEKYLGEVSTPLLINQIKENCAQKRTTLPTASVDELGHIYQYMGVTSGSLVHGYFYECVSDGQNPATYSWQQVNTQPTVTPTASGTTFNNTTSGLQATNVQDAVDEVEGRVDNIEGIVPSTATSSNKLIDHDSLGTAAFKDSTDRVSPNNTALVESQSVYSAINTALSSIYTPRGDITCAELTSSLLIAANVGNVYETSDSGTTTALFLQGAGHPIAVGSNVGVINAGQGRILFNLMANAFDLTDYQKVDLTNAVEGQTTVEGALGALSENKQDSLTFDNAPTENSNNPVKSGGVYAANQTLTSAFVNNINVNGSKNICPNNKVGTTVVQGGLTWIFNSDGTVSVTGTNTQDFNTISIGKTEPLKNGETYVISGSKWVPSGNCYIRVSKNGTIIADDHTGTPASFVADGGKYDVTLYLRTINATYDVTFEPMLCLKKLYDLDPTYASPSKTNRQLTQDSVTWDDLSEVGAVNFLNHTATNLVENGITFTVNADRSITANGTATAEEWVRIAQNVAVSESVRASGCPKGGTPSTYFMTFSQGDNSNRDYGDGVIVPSGTISSVYLVIKPNATVNNIVFKPMIAPVSYNGGYVPYAKTNQQLTAENEALTNNINVNGSKNVLASLTPSGTYLGITISRNESGDIVVNGTATTSPTTISLFDRTFKHVGEATILKFTDLGIDKTKKYVFSRAEKVSNFRYNIRVMNGTTQVAEIELGNDDGLYTVIDFSQYTCDGLKADIVVTNGTTITNKVFSAMLCLESDYDLDPTYKPYAMTNRELTETLTVSKGAPTENTDYIASSDLHYEKYGKVVHVFGNFETNTAILSTDALVTLFTNLPNSNGGMNGTSSQYTLCLLHDNTNDGFSYRCFVSNEGKLVSRYKAIPIGTYFADFTYICQ